MKRLIITTALAALTIGTAVGGVMATTGSADAPAPTAPEVTQTLQHDKERLDNHEARITNTEGNVVVLQNRTGTPPTTTVTVPQVVTPQPTTPVELPAPTPPVTVATFESLTDGENVDCKLNYTDGTSHTWRQLQVVYNQGTRIVTQNGVCNSTLLGKVK